MTHSPTSKPLCTCYASDGVWHTEECPLSRHDLPKRAALDQMKEQPSSKEQLREGPPNLDEYLIEWSKRGYEPHVAILLAKADWSEDMIAWAEDEIERLQRELEEEKRTTECCRNAQAQDEEIDTLKKQLSARLQQIEELRMAERLNVETVSNFQKRIDELERENQALRNLANNLRPGPISEALAGSMDEDYRRAGLPPSDALTLAKRFHEAYERLAPSFGYETRLNTRAFDPFSKNGRLMLAVCAEIGAPATTSDPFANAPLTGPGSRLEADLVQIRASGEKEGIACPPCQMELGGKPCGDCGYAPETGESR